MMELWASDNEANRGTNRSERRGPPPEASLFAGHEDARLIYANGQYVGAVVDGQYVSGGAGTIRVNRGSASTQESRQEERVEPKVSDFLPDAAEVFRPPKGRIGFLFDKRIHGPDGKGIVGVRAPQNGDIIISNGKPVAKYNDGWKEIKLPQ
ncbi:uncharacterized protein LOC117178970 [Belonocnema kinseyi]|uniref:uncharacterized protein LOC117178970 n=1 Tax=Belonocnema kinseyi TaxID=2817044 RepID=UPI00143DFB8A|nr:uncharacterized protein LOC117178970 [Belonocnema kinseyi]